MAPTGPLQEQDWGGELRGCLFQQHARQLAVHWQLRIDFFLQHMLRCCMQRRAVAGRQPGCLQQLLSKARAASTLPRCPLAFKPTRTLCHVQCRPVQRCALPPGSRGQAERGGGLGGAVRGARCGQVMCGFRLP